jgi:hypothetical protein
VFGRGKNGGLNLLKPPTRMLRFEFTVTNINLNAILVANAFSYYTTSGIYSVETQYDVFKIKLFSNAWDYSQLVGIFVTNILLFLIVFNDAEIKISEDELERKKEKQIEEQNKNRGLQKVADEGEEVQKEKEKKINLR